MRVLPAYPDLFFFNDTATTEIYTLSLHDALPISPDGGSPVSCAADATAPTPPTVSNYCNTATITPSGPATSGTYNGCSGTIIYTWTYTDPIALTHHCSPYTYTSRPPDFAIDTPDG